MNEILRKTMPKMKIGTEITKTCTRCGKKFSLNKVYAIYFRKKSPDRACAECLKILEQKSIASGRTSG